MRWPLFRREGDDAPIARWEMLFVPLTAAGVVLFLLVMMFVSIPVFALYPELVHTAYDGGTEREQELMRRFRRFTSRITFWTRCRRVLTVLCRVRRLKPPRRAVRRARLTGGDPAPGQAG